MSSLEPLRASGMLQWLHLGSRPLLQGPRKSHVSLTGHETRGHSLSLSIQLPGGLEKGAHTRLPKACRKSSSLFVVVVNSHLSQQAGYGLLRSTHPCHAPKLIEVTNSFLAPLSPFLHLLQWLREQLGWGRDTQSPKEGE